MDDSKRERNRERSRRYRERHPDRVKTSYAKWKASTPRDQRAYMADYYRANRDKYLAYARTSGRARRLAKYGLTIAEYDALLADQHGTCAICAGTPRYFVIDHDHETNRVRGLLCNRCNLAIGALGDTHESLVRAVAYLSKAADAC
jgi:hypothetical protein